MPAASRTRPLLLVCALGACASPPPGGQPARAAASPTDVRVPASSASDGIIATAPSVARETKSAAWAAEGWLLASDELTPRAAPRDDVIAALRAAPRRSIAQVTQTLEECSGLGGSHVFFEIVRVGAAQPGGMAHLGGHGVQLSHAGAGSKGPHEFAPGGWFVVGLTPAGAPMRTADPGWCLDQASAVEARVLAAIAIAGLEEAQALLDTL
jgi:hypothetical protein